MPGWLLNVRWDVVSRNFMCSEHWARLAPMSAGWNGDVSNSTSLIALTPPHRLPPAAPDPPAPPPAATPPAAPDASVSSSTPPCTTVAPAATPAARAPPSHVHDALIRFNKQEQPYTTAGYVCHEYISTEPPCSLLSHPQDLIEHDGRRLCPRHYHVACLRHKEKDYGREKLTKKFPVFTFSATLAQVTLL